MRATHVLFAITAVALPAARAHADNFVEVAGGIMIPVEDSDWTDYVESGPKVAARVGGVGDNHLGALLSVDWTPLNTDFTGFGPDDDVSAHRFRLQINVATEQKVGPKLFATFRVGGGVDITRLHIETNLGPFGSTTVDDTDSGLALEAAGGLWFKIGSLQVGGEVGLPLAFHADGDDDDFDGADYSSFDLDILFGVRFTSK